MGKMAVWVFGAWMGWQAHASEILIVGDSLSCGPFGQQLMANLVNRGHNVDLYCAVSSAAANWVLGQSPKGQICQTSTQNSALTPCGGTGQTPPLTTILARKSYQSVIVGLGTNSLLSPTVDANYAKVAQLISSNHSACNWVAPPHLRPDQAKGFTPARLTTMEANLDRFYLSLASATPACSFFDSRPVTAKTTPGGETVDGVHRTGPAGQSWAGFVSTALTP